MDRQKKRNLKPLLIVAVMTVLTIVSPMLLGSCQRSGVVPTPKPTGLAQLQPAPTPTIAGSLTSADATSTPKATVSPSPDPTPKPDKVQKLLDSMTLEEKIGQMIIGGYDTMDEILPVIGQYKLGGVILFKKNITSDSQTIKDIKALKDQNVKNKVPLFVSVDQEGGRVVRLPEDMGTFESAQSIGNQNNATHAYNSGVKIAKALNKLGFNLDFAPVLDIFSNPKNTVIGDRAFGTTPDRVSAMSVQVMNGLQEEKIIPCGKHFPGHGDTLVDSHVGLPVVSKSVEELKAFEFKPFENAIENHIDMIMVAHIMLSKVENVPASLSSKVVTDILRKQLGFTGVVITDDLSMGAIIENNTIQEASVKAVNAGCDIVLVSQGAQNSVLVFNALKAAVDQGKITEKQINESVYRILTLKAKYGLVN